MRRLTALLVCAGLGAGANASVVNHADRALAWAQRLYDTAPPPPAVEWDQTRKTYETARDAAVQVIHRFGPDYRRLMLLGHCDMRLGNYADAEASFSSAAGIRPFDSWPTMALAKAREYHAAAVALATWDHHRRPVQEVVRIADQDGVSWLGALVDDPKDGGYAKDVELVVFVAAGQQHPFSVSFALALEEVGEFYEIDLLDLERRGRSQIVFRGLHELGDGSRSGRVVVLEPNGSGWKNRFDKRFYGSAWIGTPSPSGHRAISIENPLYWRASASWLDIYEFKNENWLKSDACFPARYSDLAKELRASLRSEVAEPRGKVFKRCLISEAIGDAEAIAGRPLAALRALRNGRIYGYGDVQNASTQWNGNESALSRIERKMRAIKARTSARQTPLRGIGR